MNELEARLLLEKIEVYAAQNQLLGAFKAQDREAGVHDAAEMVNAYEEAIKETVLGLVKKLNADDIVAGSITVNNIYPESPKRTRLTRMADLPMNHGAKIRVFKVQETPKHSISSEEGLIFTGDRDTLRGWTADDYTESSRVFGEDYFYDTEIKEFEIINTEEEGA